MTTWVAPEKSLPLLTPLLPPPFPGPSSILFNLAKWNWILGIVNITVANLLLEKYEAEYVDRFANPFPAATRGLPAQ